MTGYLYDADGTRVAKGTLSQFTCDTISTDSAYNGFTPTEFYVLGPSGEQLTETDGQGNWKHTNVYAAGTMIATYDADPKSGTQALHFQLSDWLGTRRVQTDYAGNTEETCSSLAFGDTLNCAQTALGTADDATEHHFTGKERDAESGNDYFEARYYRSGMGRFLSPDWSAKEEPVPYAQMDNPQSLNLYAYVQNNPLTRIDADGHNWMDLGVSGNFRDYDAQIAAKAQQAAAQKAAAQQQTNRQPDGSYKATDAQLKKIQEATDKKKTVGRNDQCVSACEYFTGVPGPTSSWRGGKPASELTDKDKGTAIATFQMGSDGEWHYLPDSGGHMNSGTFMGTSTKGTFWMADQWPDGQKPVSTWNVGNNPNNASMDAPSYRVIIVPNP